jgi:hypothetical protein
MAPAEKETRNKRILESVFFLKNKNKTASQTERLMEKVARMI